MRRELLGPAHPEQRTEGNDTQHFLHLLNPEPLQALGMADKKVRLVINAYPALVLSNEWLEELFCPSCGMARWCHGIRLDRVHHNVTWASRDLLQQGAHVDAIGGNPTVSETSSREAGRHRRKHANGKAFYDR